jgi:hypothetical protein
MERLNPLPAEASGMQLQAQRGTLAATGWAVKLLVSSSVSRRSLIQHCQPYSTFHIGDCLGSIYLVNTGSFERCLSSNTGYEQIIRFALPGKRSAPRLYLRQEIYGWTTPAVLDTIALPVSHRLIR